LSLRLVVPMRSPVASVKDDPDMRGASRQPRRVLVPVELRDDEKGRRRGSHGRPRCAREPPSGANNRGTLPPDRSEGTLPRQAAANQVEVFLAGRLEGQPSLLLRHPPMGAPASCATVPRTAGTHPRAQAKMPKKAPAAVAPCLRSPALPSSPTRSDAPRDRRPPNHAAEAAFASAHRIEKLLARHDVTLDCVKDLIYTDEPRRDSQEARFIYCGTANGNRTSGPASLAGHPRVGGAWNG
jgi:hypothetical protein